MSLAALFLPRAFRAFPTNFKVPLAERFAGDTVAFISAGFGGTLIAKVRLEKLGPVVCEPTVIPDTGTPSKETIKQLRRRCPTLLGRLPVIVGSTFGLEWLLRRNLEVHSQEEFSHNLRNEPNKLIGAPTEGLIYTGLLQEGGGGALVFGVARAQLAETEEALRESGCDVVRQIIPAMAVLNLMLTDPRVTSGQFTPLVIDQGYAIAVLCNETGWSEVQARRLVGANCSPEQLAELASRVGDTPRFLVAESNANNGISVANVLSRVSPGHTAFSIGNLQGDNLFVYASSLF